MKLSTIVHLLSDTWSIVYHKQEVFIEDLSSVFSWFPAPGLGFVPFDAIKDFVCNCNVIVWIPDCSLDEPRQRTST